MLFLLIAYLFIIVIFVFPFPLDVIAYFSLRTKQAGSNFKLGFFTIDVGIKLGAQGIEIDGIKSQDKNSIRENKKKLDLIYDPRVLEKLNINNINLTFQYGNKTDAFNTCIVCAVVDNISDTIHTAFQDRIKVFRKVIIPELNKDSFYLHIRIDLKVNLFIIFSTLFKIILIKFKKRLNIGGQTV